MTQSDSHENTHFSGASEYGLADAEYKHDNILGGRYRVISLLGRGGMGVVYRVEQIFLGKELALKTIDRHLMSDITVRRFQAEARAAFAVDHPSIVSVHDFGLFDDDTPFLVMEIVQGETLGERLKRGTLSVEEAISIYIQVCFGLAHAHESGVVHRDIKPNNIMLLTNVPEGIETGVKILDFGIAKLAHSDGGEVQALTQTGEIFGSPLYMSPEQCTSGKVDQRADVYSLGCVIFESLTGTPPYVGESALMTMMMHQTATIPTLKEGSLGAEFPPELERLVALMLAKNPDDRYQNLGIAAHELAALKRGEAPHLSVTINTKRPVGDEPQTGMVNLNQNSFIYTMLGVAFTTFLVSGLITYFIQAANIPVVNSVAVVPSNSESKVPAEKSFEPKMNEESVLFQPFIKRGDVNLVTKYATDLSLRELKNYPYAQILDVQDGRITDDGIAFLQDSKLLELTVNHSTIASLNSLAKLPYLQDIDLTGTKIDDSAIPEIARLKRLQKLTLVDCNISEDGLRALIPSTSLKFLVLSENKYPNAFINELYEKMPQCRIAPYRSTSKLQDLELAEPKKDRATMFEKLIAVAEKSNKDLSVIGTLLTELGRIRFHQSQFKESRKLADKAVAQFDRCGDLNPLVEALDLEANLDVEEKDTKRALAVTDRAEKTFVDTVIHCKDERLLPMLNSFTFIPIKLGAFDPAIEYSQTSLNFVERYPDLDKEKKWLPIFLEKLGWLYSMKNNYELARPYLERVVNLTRVNKDQDPQPYLRAIIEYAHSLALDYANRKALYKEGIDGLEKLGLPEDYNLKEHYCNACTYMSDIFAVEHNYDAAALYSRKGLEAVRQFKHADDSKRQSYFSESLVKYLRAAGREAEAKKEIAKYGVKL